jgi:hypothetical protein
MSATQRNWQPLSKAKRAGSAALLRSRPQARILLGALSGAHCTCVKMIASVPVTSVRGAPVAPRSLQRLRLGRAGGLYYDDWSALATQRYPAHTGPLGPVRDYIEGGAFV